MRDVNPIIDFLVPAVLKSLVDPPGSATVLTVRRSSSDARHSRTPAPLWLVGEVDLVTSADLLGHLRGALEDRSTGPVVLDLSRTTFLDLTGLRMLLRFDDEAAAAGRELVLRAPSAPVRLLLRITDIGKSLTVVDDPVAGTETGHDAMGSTWSTSGLPPVG